MKENSNNTGIIVISIVAITAVLITGIFSTLTWKESRATKFIEPLTGNQWVEEISPTPSSYCIGYVNEDGSFDCDNQGCDGLCHIDYNFPDVSAIPVENCVCWGDLG